MDLLVVYDVFHRTKQVCKKNYAEDKKNAD